MRKVFGRVTPLMPEYALLSFFVIAFASYVEESSSSNFSESFLQWMTVSSKISESHRIIFICHDRPGRKFGSEIPFGTFHENRALIN